MRTLVGIHFTVRDYILRIFLLGLLLLLPACSQAGLTALNVPAYFDDGAISHDIVYGPEDGQKLDI